MSRNLKQMGLSEKIRLQIRSFLVILVILLLVLAIILIIRAAFLLKTSEPNILNSELGLPENPPILLENLPETGNTEPGYIWGEDITKEIHKEAIILKNENQTFVLGTNEDELILELVLPANTKSFKWFDTSQFLFTTNLGSSKSSELVGLEDSVQKVFLTLPPGSDFESVLFDPVDDVFYASIIRSTQEQSIVRIDQSGRLLELGKLYEEGSVELTEVNAGSGRLSYVVSTGNDFGCYQFNLINKEITSTSCILDPIYGIVNEIVDEELIETVREISTDEVLVTASEDEEYLLLGSYGQKSLLLKLKEDARIIDIILTTGEIERSIPSLPSMSITSMSGIDDRIILVGVNDFGDRQIYLETESSWQLVELGICGVECEISFIN